MSAKNQPEVEFTEDLFRGDDKLRTSLIAFLNSEAGKKLQYLLREKAKVRPRSPVAIHHDAVENCALAELSRLGGIQETIDFITSLCNKPKITITPSLMKPLGEHPESDLAPKMVTKAQRKPADQP